jgi:hypothetical protein
MAIMNKRIFSSLLLVTLIGVAGCTGESPTPATDSKPYAPENEIGTEGIDPQVKNLSSEEAATVAKLFRRGEATRSGETLGTDVQSVTAVTDDAEFYVRGITYSESLKVITNIHP